MDPNPLPAGWRAYPLPGGRVRLSCVAALRRVGAGGCLMIPGAFGAVCSSLILMAAPDRARPGLGPLFWAVFVLSAVAVVWGMVGALLTREEFVAGPGHFAARRRGAFGGWSSRAARGGGVRLSIETHLSRPGGPHHSPYWVRDLYVESAAGGQRITVAFDTHPLTGAPADDRAVFSSDNAARIAGYLAGVTGWPVEDDGVEVVRRQYAGWDGRA